MSPASSVSMNLFTTFNNCGINCAANNNTNTPDNAIRIIFSHLLIGSSQCTKRYNINVAISIKIECARFPVSNTLTKIIIAIMLYFFIY